VVSSHRPREVEKAATTVGVMNFLSIHEDQSLPRRKTPN
jgi:hypothetical protein